MEAKRFITIALLLTLLAFCAACLPTTTNSSGTAPGGGRVSGPDALLASAEAAYNQGQYQAAAEGYKKYLQAVPNPPQLETILASYGLSAEKAGQFNEAAAAYERLNREIPGGQFTRETQPRLAAVYLAQGEAARAESLAASLLAKESDAVRQGGLRLTLAQSQWTLGRFTEAAGNFLTVWRSTSGPTKSAAEAGALASLVRLSPTALEQVQKQYGQNFPGPEATYLLARQAAESGNRDRTVALAQYFDHYFASNKLKPQVAAVVAAANGQGSLPPLAFGENYDPRLTATTALAAPAVQATMGNLGTIGNVTIAVILPLTGDSASPYAQEIVSGLKLAVGGFAAAGSVGLNVLDSRGSPEEAARLVAEAAADPKVLAVVGPFLSREAAQAAQAANRAGLPLIAISQRTDLPGVGPNVFRLFLTPKHQAEAVARYAAQVQGQQALGILYPDDNYGRPMRTYFENEARRLGAQVTVAEGYDPKATDWGSVVSRLTGGQVARKVASTYQAKTDFTALYLPDSPAASAQILAQMAFHDVTRMQYLGSSLWFNQDFLASSSRYIQGAVIPVALSELSQREESRRFIANFQSTYGHAPDQFAAYGYDAGLAVIKALGQGANTREGVRRALSQGGPVPGATGPFSFDAAGEYVVEPTLLSVQGRAFILLREAGGGSR